MTTQQSILPTISLTSSQVRDFLTEKKLVFQTDALDGGFQGFQNYGHIGLVIKNRIIELWRKIFLDNNVYEIDTPALNMDKVLERSGHVARFNDPIVTNGTETFRADHFLEDMVSVGKLSADALSSCDMKNCEQVKSIIVENKLMEGDIIVKAQNLMFKAETSYLRPEIAQSMFVEFKQMYQYHNGKLPLTNS